MRSGSAVELERARHLAAGILEHDSGSPEVADVRSRRAEGVAVLPRLDEFDEGGVLLCGHDNHVTEWLPYRNLENDVPRALITRIAMVKKAV